MTMHWNILNHPENPSSQMRAVAKYNRDELRARGEQGRTHLLREFSSKRAERQASEVLAKIHQILESRS